MGLGFRTRTQLRRQGRFSLLSTVVSHEELAEAFCHCARGTPLEGFASKSPLPDRNGYAVELHPAAEAVFIESDGDHALVSAKTSNVGPGYHAFLVNSLDNVGKSLGLNWEWDQGDEGEYLDETGYFQDRDFAKLKREIAANVRAIFDLVVGRTTDDHPLNFMISMPVDFRVSAAGSIVTPLGPIPISDGTRLARLEDDDLLQAVADVLPWWEQEFDGRFFRGLGLQSMWMDLRWCAPLDDLELNSMKRTLDWCSEAERHGAILPIPHEAIEELRDLIAAPAPDFPKEGGIGYRRSPMTKSLAAGWELSVPGSLAETVEDDGETLVFWNAVLTIRASSMSAHLKGEATANAVTLTGDSDLKVEFERLDDGFGLQAVAESASRRGTREICFLTLWMKDEGLRGMCERIVQTLSFREPELSTDN